MPNPLLCAAAAALASALALAQSPLTTTFANNNGGATDGAVYFDLTVSVPSITITQIDLNAAGTASATAALDVLTIPGSRANNQTNLAAWTGPQSLGNSFAIQPAPTPSVVNLATPLVLSAGTWGLALRASGFAHNYTNGTGSNQTYSTAELTLNAGEASNVAFAAPLFTPRVANCSIHYTVNTGGGTVATQASYGTGCARRAASFYEHFVATSSIDLANTAIGLLFTGQGYVALASGTAFVPPSATAQNLNLGDDTETTIALSQPFAYPGGATSSLVVGSNGHIAVASNGAAGDYTPTPAELLGWANTAWAVWRDLIPNASNNVKFEEVAGKAIVTWDGVVGYNGTAAGSVPSTFQFQFDLATGNVDLVFLGLDTQSVSGWAGGEGWVVGYSPGGPSLDGGSLDLTAVLPGSLPLPGSDVAPLALQAGARPLAGTTVALNTTNIPAGAPFGAVLLGITQFNPGIPLAGIGMPGCFQYNEGAASLLFFPAGSTGSVPFNVPNAVGVQVFAQSAVFAPASGLTPLGAISSNGVALTIGNL